MRLKAKTVSSTDTVEAQALQGPDGDSVEEVAWE